MTVRSCHGMGKTKLAAAAALWWFETRPNSIVVSTAPTSAQVRGLLWREIRDMHRNAKVPLPGRVMVTRAEMDGSPRWYMEGFSVSDPIAAQGKHAEGGLLFIGDEASGIPDDIFDITRGYRTGGNAKRLYIGNPNARSGRFYESHEGMSGSQFSKFQVSAYDVPQVVRGTTLMSPEWIESVKADCGPGFESHPMYQVQVLGEWPSSDQDALIPLELLEKCADLEPSEPYRTIGVDVARLGDDRSVAYLNDGGRIKARHEWTKARTHESAEIISQLMEQWSVTEARNVKVDVTGVGGGVVDDLHRRSLYVEPVDFGGGVKGDWSEVIGQRYKLRNRRDELHIILWRLMMENRLSIPRAYQAAWADAQALRLQPNPGGFLQIESKDKMRKRRGKSPDDTDAILCSLSRAGTPAFEPFIIPARSRRRWR